MDSLNTSNFDNVSTASSKQQYFDKYFLKIEDTRKEAEQKIRYTFNNLNQKNLEPPSSEEILSLLPSYFQEKRSQLQLTSYQSLPLSHQPKPSPPQPQVVEWNELEGYYVQEFKKKDTEWTKHYEYLKYCWEEIQEIFIRNLKFKIDYSLPAARGPIRVEDSKLVTENHFQETHFQKLIDNPRFLEDFSFQELLKQKEIIESQIALEIKRLETYKIDLKNFLKEWESYRVAKIKFAKLSVYRSAQLKENLDDQLIELEKQYKSTKVYIVTQIGGGGSEVDRRNQIPKKVDVICNHNSFQLQQEFILNPIEKVETFIQRVLNSSSSAIVTTGEGKDDEKKEKKKTPTSSLLSSSMKKSAQAFILGGPKMKEDCLLGDYNFNLIKTIKIIFLE
jgi:hypothetical protein